MIMNPFRIFFAQFFIIFLFRIIWEGQDILVEDVEVVTEAVVEVAVVLVDEETLIEVVVVGDQIVEAIEDVAGLYSGLAGSI